MPPQKRIIVVDDEYLILEMLGEHLKIWDYEVLPFNDPEAAMTFFAQYHGDIDLAIIDLTMPGLTGDQMAAQMRAATPNLPIIVTTGYINRTDIEGNVSMVLYKPITKEELCEAIDQLIGPSQCVLEFSNKEVKPS